MAHGATVRCHKCLEKVETCDAQPYEADEKKVYFCQDCWARYDPREE